MRSSFPRLAIVGAIALMASGVGPVGAPQDPRPIGQLPTFRGGANLVLVDAYPQRDGKVVEGLTAADFEVLEDGKPQKVEAIEFVRVDPGLGEASRKDPNSMNEMRAQARDPHSHVFVVFLDIGQTSLSGSHEIRRPLVRALDRMIGTDDLFGFATPRMRPQDLTLGRRLLTVDEQLEKYWYWGSKDKRTDLDDPVEMALRTCFEVKIANGVGQPWYVNDHGVSRILAEALIERRREDKAMAAVMDLVTYMPQLREARTILLLISDGWLLFRPNDPAIQDLATDDRFKTMRPLRSGDPPPGGGSQPVALPGGARARVSVGENSSEFAACVSEAIRVLSIDDDRRFKDLIERANRNNVSFYPVAADGLMVFDVADAAHAREGVPLAADHTRIVGRTDSMRTVAENTGGIAVVDTNNLDAGLQRIVDDVSAYYLLGYYSTNTQSDGKYRRIDVRMKTAGVRVHARRGYVAATPSATAGAPPSPGAGVDVGAALAELDKRNAAAELFVHVAAGPSNLDVAVELPARAVSESAWSGGATVVVDLVSQDGASLATGQSTIEANARGALVRLSRPVSASGPGWQIRARARPVGAAGAALEGRAEVPAAESTLLGTPTLYRATPSPRSPLRAVADFQWRRTERLHVEVPVLATLDQRQARVLDRRGQPLPVGTTLTERDVDGRSAIAVDVALAPLTEGDYVLEVTAGQGATAARRLVAFHVVR